MAYRKQKRFRNSQNAVFLVNGVLASFFGKIKTREAINFRRMAFLCLFFIVVLPCQAQDSLRFYRAEKARQAIILEQLKLKLRDYVVFSDSGFVLKPAAKKNAHTFESANKNQKSEESFRRFIQPPVSEKHRKKRRKK
jgi:hypothetical protein